MGNNSSDVTTCMGMRLKQGCRGGEKELPVPCAICTKVSKTIIKQAKLYVYDKQWAVKYKSSSCMTHSRPQKCLRCVPLKKYIEALRGEEVAGGNG